MTSHQNEQGMVEIQIKLPPDEAELVLQAIEKMVDAIRRDDGDSQNVSAETSVSDEVALPMPLEEPLNTFSRDRANALIATRNNNLQRLVQTAH